MRLPAQLIEVMEDFVRAARVRERAARGRDRAARVRERAARVRDDRRDILLGMLNTISTVSFIEKIIIEICGLELSTRISYIINFMEKSY